MTELEINLDACQINAITFTSDASAHNLYTKYSIRDGELWASVIGESVESIHDFMSFVFKK